MGWQPGQGDGAGGESRPVPGLPGTPAGPDCPGGLRDPRLAGFARDGDWDACPPSAALAAALEDASGAGWRCPGAARDELFGMLRRWAALESWAAAGKLGVLRALIREEGEPLPGGGWHGDLPDGWTKSLTHEVALALAMPPQSAETLMWTAWELQARLPQTGALLAAGTLTYAKARAVSDALAALSDQDAAAAEAMIAAGLPGKTYGQTEKLAGQAAAAVDPHSAARRREDAERNRARVVLRRDPSGAASLGGCDLPADETLAAHASVCTRAGQYKDAGVFPGVRMDQFRAMAYLDILNGITVAARIACGQPPAGLGAPNDDQPGNGTSGRRGPQDPGPGTPGSDAPDGNGPGGNRPGGGSPEGDGPDDGLDNEPPEDDGLNGETPEDGGPDDEAPAVGGPDGGQRGTGPSGDGGADRRGAPDRDGCGGAGSPGCDPPPPRLADLMLPLSTLLGLAERPGEGHGLGPLDPDLCRALAATAANSPRTTLCVTVTGPDGIAIGHGCARPAHRSLADPVRSGTRQAVPGHGPPRALAALPARVNLTVPAARLAGLSAGTGTGTAILGGWSFTRTGDPGPPGGFGTWTLTCPDGRQLTVNLQPVPVLDCDHRYESHSYQPSDTLRHLVQVRDGECTFPTCSRHARECDYEHATPYDRGGRTCCCNAGARSRQCHRVKQSKGWTVTQPRPGWHQWETPSGRIYTQGPKRYPA